MRIAIIGAGSVGAAIGRAWLKAGHDIQWGVPDPAKYADLPPERVHTPDLAAGTADVILLAVPWSAAEHAIAGLGDVSGKILIDATNPLEMGENGLQLAVGFTTSGAERVAGWARGARVFKALNQTGAESMGDAGRYRSRPVMFIAGDDEVTKPTVMQLVGDLGFEAIDGGPLTNARLLEPHAMLWIDQAMKRGAGRDFAFAVERVG